jgi:hypothetical protein
MSLILSGTDGLSDVDGSAATPAIRGTDANTGIFFPAADTIAFAEGGVESMRIDSAGNLGLGVTPSAWGTANSERALQLNGGSLWSYSTFGLGLINNAFYNSSGNYIYSRNGFALDYFQSSSSGGHIWRTAASGTAGNAITFTQAMTLDSSGNLLVGKTATSLGVVGVEAKPNGYAVFTMASSTNSLDTLNVYSSTATNYRFYVGLAGTVFATNTAITAISDQRLKENIRDLDDGLNVVLALKPRKFDWKEGKGADIKNARGFIAQEFEQVLPDMIDIWKDPAPEGEEPYKAVNANLIPTLVKAIQEQQAIIESLKARLDAANL